MRTLHTAWAASLAADIARLAGCIDPRSDDAVAATLLLADAVAARWYTADAIAAGTCDDGDVAALFGTVLDLADLLGRPAPAPA